MPAIADFSAWLVSLGIQPAPIDSAYAVTPRPGRMIVLVDSGGPGDVFERTFDRMALAIDCYGKQRQYQDGEALMNQVDTAILSVIPPVEIGGVFVNDIARISRPRFGGVDKNFRPVFRAAYLFQYALALNY